MNLDHLSQRWQQQAAPLMFSPAAAELSALLARRANSPVARMQRSLWQELAALLLLGGPLAAGLLYLLDGLRSQVPLALLLALGAGTGCCYAGKLLVLRRLRAASGGLRTHLGRQLLNLRRLLRLYQALGQLANLLLAGLVLAYGTPLVPLPALGRFYVWLGLSTLVSSLVTSACLRWHLQHSYGQHLDRLEAALAELGDEPAR